MVQIPAQVDKICQKIDNFMVKYPSVTQYERLKQLESKYEVPKAVFFTVFSSVTIFLIWVIGGAKLISDLLGFLYPAYMSFKAIDSVDSADNIQWLTYWVVFSLFSILESTATILTSFIPFYFYIKSAFFVWLYHPKFMGAQLLYSDVVRPLLLPHLEQAKPAKKTS